MNSNRRVFLFVIYSVSLLLLFSLLGYFFNWRWLPFSRVNLVSDIVKHEGGITTPGEDSTDSGETIVIEKKPQEDFQLYTKGHYITSFNADTTKASLPGLMKKLYALKSGQTQKIRIAYFGDSMIESDLLTQTLRKLLQQYFGGQGVGFVPVTTVGYKIRQTVEHNIGGNWDDSNLKNAKDKSRLFLSGHSFTTTGGWMEIKDKTIIDSNGITEKSLLCGQASQPVSIRVNEQPVTIDPTGIFNRVVLATDKINSIRVAVSDPSLPVYGISIEPVSGVVVDNFSFRGVRGDEYKDADTTFLQAIAAANHYDLIVFQYGVNVLFRPNDKNFTWYAKMLMPVVQKFRHCFPDAEFMMGSTADRAFRYADGYQSAVGIDTLVKIQATIAYETGSHFYNTFQTMGGRNSIVDWANRKPALANKDYVHPNHKGAEMLGTYLFEAIVNEYQKYQQSLTKKEK